jgi:integrase
MPKLSRSLPKYRKHRASGQAIVNLSGRDHYLGRHGTAASKREYDRLIGEWLAAGRQPLEVRPDQLSLAALCIRYLGFARTHYVKDGRPTDEPSGIKAAMRFLQADYAPRPAAKFGPLALKAVRRRMIEADLAIATINQNVNRLRRMYRWAVAEELISPIVHEALRAVPGLRRGRGEARETDPVLPVDDKIVEATLPHLPEMVADMVRFQRLTGCRPQDVCSLRPCDLDRSGEVWKYQPPEHKTAWRGHERLIPIGPKAQDILLRYLARDAHSCCFRPCDSEARRRADAHLARTTPLSCGDRPGLNRKRRPKRQAGMKYDTDAYRRAIHRACDKAFPPTGQLAQQECESKAAWKKRLTADQVPDLELWQSDHRWSPNQLRHSAGTEVRQQFGIEAAQMVLGHKNAHVTQIYAVRNFELAAKVARQIG